MNKKNDIIFTALNKECRFCFGSEKPYSPLITPCRCKGTQAYIHIHCLDKWQKVQINRPWSSKFCNVCRHPYSISPGRKLIFLYLYKIRHSNLAILIICLKLISAALIILYTKIIYKYIFSHSGKITFVAILSIIISFSTLVTFEYISKANFNIL